MAVAYYFLKSQGSEAGCSSGSTYRWVPPILPIGFLSPSQSPGRRRQLGVVHRVRGVGGRQDGRARVQGADDAGLPLERRVREVARSNQVGSVGQEAAGTAKEFDLGGFLTAELGVQNAGIS